MTSLLGIGIVNVAAYPLSIQLGGGTEGYGAMEALLGGGGLVGAALAGTRADDGSCPDDRRRLVRRLGRRARARRRCARPGRRAGGDGRRRSGARARRGRGHDARPGPDGRCRAQPGLRGAGGRGARRLQRAMLAGGVLVGVRRRASRGRRSGWRVRAWRRSSRRACEHCVRSAGPLDIASSGSKRASGHAAQRPLRSDAGLLCCLEELLRVAAAACHRRTRRPRRPRGRASRSRPRLPSRRRRACAGSGRPGRGPGPARSAPACRQEAAGASARSAASP